MTTVARHWRISTVSKGWKGGGFQDVGSRAFTRHEAEQEARRLNERYPGYRHEAVHVSWPRRRS